MNGTLTNAARRRLLIGASAGAGLSVSFFAGCSLPVIPKRPAPELSDAMGWVQHAAGRYQLWLPRVEMGQNIATACQRLACEELGIAWHLPRHRQAFDGLASSSLSADAIGAVTL